MPSTWIWTSWRGKSLVSESFVVIASPLIYLAHADLFPLLQSAGSPIRIPSAVRAEIQRRGSGDPTVRAIEAASWLEQVERPRFLRVWRRGGLGLARSRSYPGLSYIPVVSRSSTTWLAGVTHSSWEFLSWAGLVLRAKRTGEISAARPLVEKLRDAGMYLSDRILEPALRLVGE
jgi:predicted nucleic acid-binding protein